MNRNMWQMFQKICYVELMLFEVLQGRKQWSCLHYTSRRIVLNSGTSSAFPFFKCKPARIVCSVKMPKQCCRGFAFHFGTYSARHCGKVMPCVHCISCFPTAIRILIHDRGYPIASPCRPGLLSRHSGLQIEFFHVLIQSDSQ